MSALAGVVCAEKAVRLGPIRSFGGGWFCGWAATRQSLAEEPKTVNPPVTLRDFLCRRCYCTGAKYVWDCHPQECNAGVGLWIGVPRKPSASRQTWRVAAHRFLERRGRGAVVQGHLEGLVSLDEQRTKWLCPQGTGGQATRRWRKRGRMVLSGPVSRSGESCCERWL
jgi:hypothetical protein